MSDWGEKSLEKMKRVKELRRVLDDSFGGYLESEVYETLLAILVDKEVLTTEDLAIAAVILKEGVR